jgi:hypothetical protein
MWVWFWGNAIYYLPRQTEITPGAPHQEIASEAAPNRSVQELDRQGLVSAALVILARRIARTAWSMYAYKTEFDPTRLTKSLT